MGTQLKMSPSSYISSQTLSDIFGQLDFVKPGRNCEAAPGLLMGCYTNC